MDSPKESASESASDADLSESIGITPRLDKISLTEDVAGTPTKLDENQKKLVAQLRQNISADTSISELHKNWCDDWCVCRYLRARNWDLAKVRPINYISSHNNEFYCFFRLKPCCETL